MKILRTSNLLYVKEVGPDEVLFTSNRANAKQMEEQDARNIEKYLQMDLGIVTKIEEA